MEKPGRNDPCPCGSGQKYKKCCENKKAEPKKFTAQVLHSGDSATSKVQGLSKLFQRPAAPNPTEPPSEPPTESSGENINS